MHKRAAIFILLIAATASRGEARPLITEEAPTIGRHSFEAGFQLWNRTDTFGAPDSEYKTTGFPVRARLGITRWMDLGVRLDQYAQELHINGHIYEGSRNGLWSPELKISPVENAGLLLIWHKSRPEITGQDMPIARGDDYEAVALARLPMAWPVTLNAGYIWRESYHGTFGVSGVQTATIHPADIFESNIAIEVPVVWHLALVGEAAYYSFGATKINNGELLDSKGEAANALAGLVWTYGGWHIGAGAEFGLLDERHTSFDLEHGAGDMRLRCALSYRLKPKKPTS